MSRQQQREQSCRLKCTNSEVLKKRAALVRLWLVIVILLIEQSNFSCVCSCVDLLSMGISLHLSVSTSSSSLSSSPRFPSHLPPTIIPPLSGFTVPPPQALQRSSIHFFLSLPYLINDRGAETRGEISREGVPA